jgi:hypothetical protein
MHMPEKDVRPIGDFSNPRGGRFLLLTGFQLERGNNEIHCRVQLSGTGKQYNGEAREMDTPSGRARAAARATLAAAEQTGSGITLGLEGVAIIDLFSRSYVVISVEAAHNREFLTLAGMVPLDPTRPVEDAAVLATLRAIDRWIAS